MSSGSERRQGPLHRQPHDRGADLPRSAADPGDQPRAALLLRSRNRCGAGL